MELPNSSTIKKVGRNLTLGDYLRRMVKAYYRGDSDGFETALSGLVENEKQKGHVQLAKDLLKLSEKKRVAAVPTQSLKSLSLSEPRLTDFTVITDPQKVLRQLVLSDVVSAELDSLLKENRHKDVLRSYGLPISKKVLFVGAPGTGKTVVAEAFANEIGLPMAVVRLDSIFSSYLGATANNIRQVFELAQSRPMVLFFDEFDSLAKHRDSQDDHGELKRVVTSLLQLIDWFRGPSYIIAASNHKNLLDTALWRRFDKVIEFPLPGEGEIIALLGKFFKQMPLELDVNILEIARILEGLSFADVERCALEALKQTILNGDKRVSLDTIEDAATAQRTRSLVISN